MSELQRCEECGDALAATGVLGGFCPRCMVELGFDSHSGFEYPENTLSARVWDDDRGEELPTLFRVIGLVGAHPDDAPLVKEKLACRPGFECLAAVLVNDGDDGVTDTLSTAGGTVGAVPILLNNRGVHEESNLLWRQPDHDGAMLKQCPAEWLDSVEVSTLVNEPENNLSEVLEPLSASS